MVGWEQAPLPRTGGAQCALRGSVPLARNVVNGIRLRASAGREFLRLVDDPQAHRRRHDRRQGVDRLERLAHRAFRGLVGRDDDRHDAAPSSRLAAGGWRRQADAVLAEDLA